MNKKKIITFVSLISAGILLAGTTGVYAQGTPSVGKTTSTKPSVTPANPADVLAKTLVSLVSNGTITQAQSDAITSAFKAALPAKPSISLGGNSSSTGKPSVGGSGENSSEGPNDGPQGPAPLSGDRLKVVETALSISESDLQSALKEGKSLAIIAGSNTSALISALVAFDTTQINADVAAGEITADQASTLISHLTAKDTTEVNAVRKPKDTPPAGGKDKQKGKGPNPGQTPPAGTLPPPGDEPLPSPSATPTA